MSVENRIREPGLSTYKCDSCGHTSRWGDADWRVWGSINDMDDGKESHYCSNDCLVDTHGRKALTMIHPNRP